MQRQGEQEVLFIGLLPGLVQAEAKELGILSRFPILVAGTQCLSDGLLSARNSEWQLDLLPGWLVL